MTNSKRRKKKRETRPKGGVGLYHDMRVYENFERCAQRLFEVLQHAQRISPNAPRILYLDVQGHRNESGEFDRDAYELITHFSLEFLGDYLTEIHTPLMDATNRKPQRNDLPARLQIVPPLDGSTSYDFHVLPARARESSPSPRRSPPSAQAIAEYLGLDEPLCLICWQKPAERAHALPRSLSGSYDIRNFALLCKDHHQEAPDVTDAEAFWAWIDYASLRDSHKKWAKYSEKTVRRAEELGIKMPDAGNPHEPLSFDEKIRQELINLYDWQDEDFRAFDWKMAAEINRVIDEATSVHFGVKRKSSTYAWAYNAARQRTRGDGHHDQGPG